MAEKDVSHIKALEAEIERLKAELSKAETLEQEQDEACRAMLYILEDMNESTSKVEQIKDEWVQTFDAVTDPIFSHDADFRIVRANRAYAECAGMIVEDVIGKPYWEVFPKGDGPLPGCLRTIEKAGKAEEEEEEIRLESGQIFLNRTYAMHQEGNIPYSIHLMEDITERVKLQHEKDERIKELRCMFGVVESIAARNSMKEIFQDVANLIPPAWQYPEITRSKVIFDAREYVSEAFEETDWKQSSAIIVNGWPRGLIEVFYLKQCPELEEGPFEKEERTLLDGVARNLGKAIEHNQAEQAIGENEERFRSISEAAQDAIIMLDNNGCISLWNRAAENILGYSQYEAMGKDLSELIIPEGFRKKHQQGYAAFRDTGFGPVIGKTVEMNALHKNGREFPIELSLSATRIKDKWHAVGIMRDISERKQTEDALLQSHKQLYQSLEGTIQAIASAVEARDPYTAGHERRVAELSVVIAHAMGLDENKVEGIHWGALIHDIGKITLPAEILSKPSKLTDIEYSLIKCHPQVGYDILKGIEFPWPVADIAHQHHEREDGSGYPQGLKGEDICLEAKIVAVADVVEAMASHRPYRAGLGSDMALAEIKRGRGSSYNVEVVDACLRLFSENLFSFKK